MDVPAWLRRGGKGVLPTNVIRISSGPSSSDMGKKLFRLFMEGVGL
jgi:hypothetical protein